MEFYGKYFEKRLRSDLPEIAPRPSGSCDWHLSLKRRWNLGLILAETKKRNTKAVGTRRFALFFTRFLCAYRPTFTQPTKHETQKLRTRLSPRIMNGDHGSPSLPVPASGLEGLEDTDPVEDYEVEDHSFEEKLEHFLPEGKATLKSLRAVQSALIQQAGIKMTASKTVPLAVQETMIANIYHDVLAGVPERIIPATLKLKLNFFCGAQRVKCGPHDPAITGKQIHRRYREEKCEIRSHYFSELPLDYHMLESGKGLRKVEDAFIRERFRHVNRARLVKKKVRDPSINIDDEMGLIGDPDSDFEFKHLHLMLSVRIFRKSPHFASSTADVWDSATHKSRAQIRADARRHTRDKNDSALVMAHARDKHASALQGLYKVSARQAKMAEIREQLQILKEFKESMSEGTYTEKVSKLIDSLPSPDTFEKAVVVDLTEDTGEDHDEDGKENDPSLANSKNNSDYNSSDDECPMKKARSNISSQGGVEKNDARDKRSEQSLLTLESDDD